MAVAMLSWSLLGQVDPNARSTIANARAAGINYVDVYLFPCPTCSKSASGQVSDMGKAAIIVQSGGT